MEKTKPDQALGIHIEEIFWTRLHPQCVRSVLDAYEVCNSSNHEVHNFIDNIIRDYLLIPFCWSKPGTSPTKRRPRRGPDCASHVHPAESRLPVFQIRG